MPDKVSFQSLNHNGFVGPVLFYPKNGTTPVLVGFVTLETIDTDGNAKLVPQIFPVVNELDLEFSLLEPHVAAVAINDEDL